jgi:hypothetical protein
MYKRLKTLVNQILNYKSTRRTDLNIVCLMLRSFTVLDPNLMNLIRENPRYTKMMPEEILGKFLSRRMMAKEARYINDIANGLLPHHYNNKPQHITLKATNSKEALPDKVAQIVATGSQSDKQQGVTRRLRIQQVFSLPQRVAYMPHGQGEECIYM